MWLSKPEGNERLLNFKLIRMTGNHHNLLVLFYTGISDDPADRLETERLTSLIKSVDRPEHFCTANELVNRNRITSEKKKMIREAGYRRLRAFRFFINKN